MKIPTADEIIGLHKQVVNEAIDEMIEKLKNVEGYKVTATFYDEDAELIIRALNEYREKYYGEENE